MKTETQQKIQLTDHKHRSGMHGLAIVVAVSALMSGCASTGSGGVVEIGPNTISLRARLEQNQFIMKNITQMVLVHSRQ